MKKFKEIRSAGLVGVVIWVAGIATAQAALPAGLNLSMPMEQALALALPRALIALAGLAGLIRALRAWMAKKPEPSRGMPGATRLYPHLSRPSSHQDVWFDGALDRSRARRAL